MQLDSTVALDHIRDGPNGLTASGGHLFNQIFITENLGQVCASLARLASRHGDGGVSSYLSLVGARCRVMLHETLYQLLSFCVLVHTSLSVSPKSKRDQTDTPVNRPLFIGVFGNPTAPDGDGTDCDNAVTWNYYVPALAGRRSTRALNTGGPGPFSATGNMLGVLLARNSIEVRSDSV